jgi:hypothetical protein
MITLMVIAASSQGTPFYACIDAFFSTAPAFTQAALHLMADGTPWVHIITRAKSSYVAYPTKDKRKVDKIKLWGLFGQADLFQSASHPIHCEREILYHSIDLYWGNVTGLIRFVLVIDRNCHFILMCSDVNLAPLDILKCYALRSKIEINFFTLKHIIGGFCYRFWTSCWPVAGKKGANGLVVPVSDSERGEKGLRTLMAIERFVNLAIIAQGILQYLAITRSEVIWQIHTATSWLRTYSSDIPSIEVVQRALQAETLLNSKMTCSAWIKSLLKWKKKSKVPKNDTLGLAFLS